MKDEDDGDGDSEDEEDAFAEDTDVEIASFRFDMDCLSFEVPCFRVCSPLFGLKQPSLRFGCLTLSASKPILIAVMVMAEGTAYSEPV